MKFQNPSSGYHIETNHLKKCSSCFTLLLPKGAKVCPNCGKRQGWTWPAKIFLALIILGIIGYILGQFGKPEQKAPPSLTKQDESFNKLTPAEHLEEAKKALSDGYKPNKDIMKTTWGRVTDAKKHLEAIKTDTSEYNEAKNLMQEVSRREKEIKKVAAIIADQFMAEKRKNFSKEYEISLLDKGMDVHVSTSGKEHTILKIRWVLMNRPLVYKFITDKEAMPNLKKLRFKKIIFTDGYDMTWSFDLEKL